MFAPSLKTAEAFDSAAHSRPARPPSNLSLLSALKPPSLLTCYISESSENPAQTQLHAHLGPLNTPPNPPVVLSCETTSTSEGHFSPSAQRSFRASTLFHTSTLADNQRAGICPPGGALSSLESASTSTRGNLETEQSAAPSPLTFTRICCCGRGRILLERTRSHTQTHVNTHKDMQTYVREVSAAAWGRFIDLMLSSSTGCELQAPFQTHH